MSFVCDKGLVRAAKRHWCWYCNQAIEVGEIHGARAGTSDGSFWTMRFHPECDAWAGEHWDADEYEGHEPGEFVRPMTAFDPAI